MTVIVRDYKTWDAYLADVSNIPRSREDSTWGLGTTSDALVLARKGWPEGMSHVRLLTMPAVESIASKIVGGQGLLQDTTGAAYDVGEYLSGVPECWIAPVAEESKPVITLQLDTTTSGIIGNQVLIQRGAAFAALVMALQAAGYVVECSAIVGVQPDYKVDVWVRVNLVDGNGGPLDLDRLIYALAHPTYSRILGYNFAHYLARGGLNNGLTAWPDSKNPWTADLAMERAHNQDTNFSSSAKTQDWLERTFAQLTTNRHGVDIWTD